jgi:hypothetical protein
LTTYRSYLQITITLSLISTLSKSLQHMLSLFSVCCVSTSSSLVTALTVGMLQLHRPSLLFTHSLTTTYNSLCYSSGELSLYVTTDGQSASLSWNKAPVWGLRPDFYYCQTVAGLLMWGAVSDERTGLSFTIAAGPRQRSHSRVRVPWDSRPHFSVSDSRLPFSSPPTTRRATVEVFDSMSTWDTKLENFGVDYNKRQSNSGNNTVAIPEQLIDLSIFYSLFLCRL